MDAIELLTLFPPLDNENQTRAQNQETSAGQEKSAVEVDRRDSILDAQDFVRDFVRERWKARWDSIRIECGLTMAELKALGRLPRSDGTQACCRLIRAPVIYEEIAITLWERLAEDEAASTQNREREKDSNAAPETGIAQNVTQKTTTFALGFGRWIMGRRKSYTNSTNVPTPRRPRCAFCNGPEELSCGLTEEMTRFPGEERQRENQTNQPFWRIPERRIIPRDRDELAGVVEPRSSWSGLVFEKINRLAAQNVVGTCFGGASEHEYGNTLGSVRENTLTLTQP